MFTTFEGNNWLAFKPLTAKCEASMLPFDSSASCYFFITDTLTRLAVAVFDTLFSEAHHLTGAILKCLPETTFLRLLHHLDE
jgi:hypothetical protein